MTAVRNQETLDDLCEALRGNCGDVAGACSQVRCSTGWLKNWRRDDPKVDAAIDDAIETGALGLESAMIKRATKGWKEPVFQNGALVGHKRKFSDPLLIKALEARLPERYGRKMEINNNVNIRNMSDNELDTKITMLMDRLGMKQLPAPGETIEDAEFTECEVIMVDDLL
jgi:hypothetical protein